MVWNWGDKSRRKTVLRNHQGMKRINWAEETLAFARITFNLRYRGNQLVMDAQQGSCEFKEKVYLCWQ